MAECDWAGNRGQAGVASLRPDPDLDLDLRVSTSHRSALQMLRCTLLDGVLHCTALHACAVLYCR